MNKIDPSRPLRRPGQPSCPWRVGLGTDVHALVPGRPLILGGVTIPHTMGLLGHSDADALLHAITDAVLGAGALGDIGNHFPDDDPRFEGANSHLLLRAACHSLNDAGYALVNVDATITAQAPRMRDHIPAMREHIAQTCDLDVNAVNVKAKTAERLGALGRGEGISAQAVVLVEQLPD